MTRHRINFSDHEKDYIRTNAPYRASWGSLARDLERMFPEDNQGRRNGKYIRDWYRLETHREEEQAVVEAEVPATIAAEIKYRGLSPADVGQILADGLRKRAAA